MAWFIYTYVQGEQKPEEGEDKRVTVIETATGNKLKGEDAPKKSELEEWLKEHTGYEVVESDEEQDEEQSDDSDVCYIL